MKKQILVLLVFGYLFQSHGISLFINKNDVLCNVKEEKDSSLFNLLNLINKNLYSLHANKGIQGKINNSAVQIPKELVSDKGLRDIYKVNPKNIFIHGERNGFTASELSNYHLHEIDSIVVLWNTQLIGLQAVYGNSSEYGVVVLHPKKGSYKKNRAKTDISLQNVLNDSLIKGFDMNKMVIEIQTYLNAIGCTPDANNYIIMENRKINLSDLTANTFPLGNTLKIKFVKSNEVPSGTKGLIHLTKGAF